METTKLASVFKALSEPFSLTPTTRLCIVKDISNPLTVYYEKTHDQPTGKTLNINIETIRFYERKGLIVQPKKPPEGYRHYPDETLNRIRFIKRAQELGFTLDEITNLLTLNDHPCGQVQALAEHKLSSVQEKIADLKRLESALKEMISQCRNNPDDDHCPIIDSLQP